MTRLRLLTLLFPVLLTAPGCASTSGQRDASVGELRDMIDLCDQFVRAPEAVDPAPIVRFMNESPEVLVVLGPHLDGVATGDAVPKWASSMLLSGYIAGNVRAQLVAGRKQDDPTAGFRGVLSVYQVLQAKGLSMPEIDELARMERKGELETWVGERLSAADPESRS